MNPTYQISEDSDSHHYIEPMEWNGFQLPEEDQERERSPELRQRSNGNTGIRAELPSRNMGQMEEDDASVVHQNSNHGANKFRGFVSRQMDHNALFELLSRDPEVTNEQMRETLRSANQSLTMKRQVKARLSNEEAKQQHKQKTVSISKRIKYHIAMNWQHLRQEALTFFQSLDLWHSHLKAVQGHFGSGVASYFFFLRRLFFLNLMACVLLLCFIIIPQIFWDIKYPSKTPSFGGYELLTGDGYFKDTLLYYGHYTNNPVGPYKMPEAYVFTNLVYIIFCVFILTFSVAKSYRVNHIETAGELKNVFANKLLSAWDYSIEKEAAARLKSRSICIELLELISEEAEDMKLVKWGKKLANIFWRIIINLLIFGAMGGTGYVVNLLLSEEHIKKVDVMVLKEITVALVVTGFLFFVPFVFVLMSRWENYSSKQTQLYVNVIRVVLLRAVILGVVVAYFIRTRATPSELVDPSKQVSTTVDPSMQANTTVVTNLACWETNLGQEMYRLIVIDFLCILLLPTLAMELLRRIFYDNCCKCVGYPEFDIAQNTVDLVYTQMLVWVGFFYSPLLPFIAVVKLLIIFYVKRLSVIKNCLPPQRAWRAAHAQTLFLTLTFFCFLLSQIALGYSILSTTPSRGCGPFRDWSTIYDLVMSFLKGYGGFKEVISYLVSPAVVAGFLLFLCVVVYYKRATAIANMDMVKLLREQLTLEGKDKVFLLQLFEKAMIEQPIISYISNFGRSTDTPSRGDSSDSLSQPNYAKEPDDPNRNYKQVNGSATDSTFQQNVQEPRWESSKDKLHELQREKSRSDSLHSTPREGSPFVSPGFHQGGAKNYGPVHRFDARDSPPFLSSQHGTTRDNSPYTGANRYPPGSSPQGSWDRRPSQGSQLVHQVNQTPLLMKPAHQPGFRHLTPGPRNSSRQSTPQRL